MYLLKCASLIMVFPSISVPQPSRPTLPHPSFHEDPTSLGRDVLPLKLHGEFCFSPSPWLPQQHATVYSATTHHLLYLSFVSRDIFNTCRSLGSHSSGRGESQRGVFLSFIFLQVIHFLCVCVLCFCGGLIKQASNS